TWLRSVCAAVLFGLSGGWAYAAAPVTTTVYPTGSFPLDVQNVQAAIDRGGTGILKATNKDGQPTAFDFGPPEPETGDRGDLTADVSISGERVGPYATTIKGGHLPIRGAVPVKSTIQGIDFDGPLGIAIDLVRSTSADIIGNRIRGVVPIPLFFG